MGAVQKLSALFSIVRARHGWVQGRLIKQRMQISLFKARQTCWKRVQLSWSGKFHRSKTSVRPKDNSGKFSFSCHRWNLIKGEKALNRSVHERPDRCVIWIHTFFMQSKLPNATWNDHSISSLKWFYSTACLRFASIFYSSDNKMRAEIQSCESNYCTDLTPNFITSRSRVSDNFVDKKFGLASFRNSQYPIRPN